MVFSFDCCACVCLCDACLCGVCLVNFSFALIQEADLSEQPACIINGKMRAYQLEGLNWMRNLYANGKEVFFLLPEQVVSAPLDPILCYCFRCRWYSGG